MKLIIIIISILVFSCNDQRNRTADTSNKRDTITVVKRDTIKIEDEGMVETINYYKDQNLLLWKAIDLMDVTNPANYQKIRDINYQIVSGRDKHNNRVTRDLINDFKKISARQ